MGSLKQPRVLIVQFFALFVAPLYANEIDSSTRPNIVLILADDLGFDDVGFHGSTQISTPNIDALARQGIIFNRFYSQSVCTPSRAALMTAKYPFRIGMQADPIKIGEPWGLPLEEKIMPEYLKEMGYSTHMIGKWHLGEHKKAYFPTKRGFDGFIGTPSGVIDYYTYDFRKGYSLYNGTEVYRPPTVKYATDLFADLAEEIVRKQKDNPFFLYLPLTAPRAGGGDVGYLQYPERYEGDPRLLSVTDMERRNYTGMLLAMDDLVGRVHSALVANQLENRTLLWFLSDNGGPITQANTFTPVPPTSNWPLRGCKRTAFDGGLRVVSFLWGASQLINTTGRISQQLMHITDILPTLLAAASLGNISHTSTKVINGINQWNAIRSGEEKTSARKEIALEIWNERGVFALLANGFKVVKGDFWNGTDFANKWTRPRGTSASKPRRQSLDSAIDCGSPVEEKTPCVSAVKPCLFKIEDDPCELDNVADKYPQVLENLLAKVAEYNQSYVGRLTKPFDPRSRPQLHGGVWAPWLD